MVGLFGLNMFNQNNNVGRELWAMTLRQGGGNPEMKVNPIYVKEDDSLKDDSEVKSEKDSEE